MVISKVLYSSASQEYRTPKHLYDKLNEEFHFKLNSATTEDNPLGTKYYYTINDNALSQPWDKDATYCNPPYGIKAVEWIKKAWDDSRKYNVTIVMLLPSRTGTRWFHEYIYNKPNVEIRFLKGRMRFEGTKNGAPFDSMICIFRG
jgi:phage N-6-adenine-methyltransferase